MGTRFFLLAVLLSLAACGRDAEPLQAKIDAQEEKIILARTILKLERKRMEALQDSLEINIRHNIALNLDSTAAATIENHRLKLQGSIVERAEHNLDSQKKLLTILKRLQSLR